jgi:hypothetical protein
MVYSAGLRNSYAITSSASDHSLNGLRPNPRVQPTPLAASEIVAILKAEFGWMVFSFY